MSRPLTTNAADSPVTTRRALGPAGYAWTVVAFTIVVILWGAVVRATGSGAGCGNNWPTCNGAVVPLGAATETLIEFGHRAVSGIAALLVLGLVIVAFRRFPAGHRVRWAAIAAGVLMVGEAAIGAGLVLFEQVGDNDSLSRAYWISGHLLNTFLLLAALALTAWWMGGKPGIDLRRRGRLALGAGLGAMLVLGLSGAITALGDTLFPSAVDRASPIADLFVRLRVVHPVLAVAVGLYLMATTGYLNSLAPRRTTRRLASLTAVLVVVQLAAGAVNVVLRAPVWMQVLHLLLADALWITVVLFTAAALARPGSVAADTGSLPSGRAAGGLLGAFVALTKPRIIELLLVTTVPAMVVAAGGWPGTGLVLATLAGGTLSAAGANAINNFIDRDIDERMRRTQSRPLPARRVDPGTALTFGVILGAAGFVVLWWAVNLLAAALATGALLFYVFVYSLGLKRTSPQNIVIGGAAGAVPVLVGWAAVAGRLDLAAWVMFAIVFYWTPPHFWALALRHQEDYRRAGVPMLPVVSGVDATTRKIALYSLVLVAITLLMVPVGGMGMAYLAVAAGLGAVFLLEAWRLIRDPKRAMVMFRFSTVYLAVLFVAMALDATVT